MDDRRVLPWLTAALADWAILLLVLAAAIAGYSIVPGIAPKALCILAGAWATGVCQHRLAILGHDAGHNTVSRNPAVNDLLGSLLVFYPLLIGLSGYRLFHNRDHHHAQAMGTPRDPEIMLKLADNDWHLPMRRRQIAKRFVLDLFGRSAHKALGFTVTTLHPGIYRAIVQDLAKKLKARGTDAGPELAPLPRRNRYRETLYNLGLIGWWTVVGLVLANVPHGSLVLLLWFGGLATSFWAVFRVRQLCEHVGTRIVQLKRPPAWWRAIIAPHSTWLHEDHHRKAGMPFHHLEDIAQLRGAQGVTLRDLFSLLTTSKPLYSGHVPADDRDIMKRAQALRLLSPIFE